MDCLGTTSLCRVERLLETDQCTDVVASSPHRSKLRQGNGVQACGQLFISYAPSAFWQSHACSEGGMREKVDSAPFQLRVLAERPASFNFLTIYFNQLTQE